MYTITVEELEARVMQLRANVEQSSANHHILVGTKLVWEELWAKAKEEAKANAQSVNDPVISAEFEPVVENE